MQYRALGNTGLNVSSIGFGAWAIGGGWGDQSDDESLAALHSALDAGVNFIDTAAGYGNGHSEKLIGRVLKERADNNHPIYVATKTPPAPGPWPPTPYCDMNDRYSEKYLRENIEQRLACLDVECIDLLQLHTWTRAWNHDPQPFEILAKLKKEGKIRHVGLSTPEYDQNAVIDLMRNGLIDTVQVIYNIFEQEPAAELLPVAQQHNVGIIVRVVFDEGVLTGKYTGNETFPATGDFRARYFAGDRLQRAVDRVEKIKQALAAGSFTDNYTMPQAAIHFALAHPAVSTIITGVRNVTQAQQNAQTADLPPMSDAMLHELRQHHWNRAFWYVGK